MKAAILSLAIAATAAATAASTVDLKRYWFHMKENLTLDDALDDWFPELAL